MSRTWIRWIIVAVLVVAAFAVWRSGLLAELNLQGLKARQESLATWVSANHWIALGSFFAVYVAVTGLSLPGAAILTLAGGALFGLVEGTVLISFASSIGATLAFLVSRFVLRDSLRSKYGQRLKSFDAGIERDGAYYLFTLRLVPAVPFFLVNLLAGLTALKTRVFYLVSQAGMLPGTIAYVYAGTQLARIDSLSDILSPGLIGAFVLLGILPLLMRWLTRWLGARRVYAGFQRPRRFDFNLIVIGAGSAGLVSAYIAAAVKAKVALIERHRMGGDCLNTGCVPSKALLRSARLLADARNSERYGIAKMSAEVDFAEVMQRVHEVIAKVAPHDSVERYTGLGVEVIRGNARIVSPWEVEVDGQRLSARSLIIATGAQARVPEIEGLDSVDYRTSDTLWEIRELPKRLVVVGGGPIGCELSQAFARLGSQVIQVQRGPRLLPREDADAATLVEERFAEEGIRVETDCEAVRVERTAEGGRLLCRQHGEDVTFEFDRLLLALGRKPNVAGFGLEELGVVIEKQGTVQADALMRTNYPNILVAGDVAGPYQFTHVAAHQAWYASVNALLAPFWSFKANYRVIPWSTFTDPEVARVGLSEDEAKEKGIEVEVTKYGLDDLDRAIADSADHGFVKVLTAPGKDAILGATIVGEHAGDLLAEFVLAMKHGIGLNKLLGTIHIYPTMSEANKYAAGAWKRAHAPEAALRLARRFFAWRRG
ncbi:FAD-dependent oxidoreductase [Dokdonella immobilis]|uniref:Pyruvate/2-oxoglutarate dehydrogenase complex, dihydrolipoamide dehydrogenase (E3) component n=1 Tax=Dokdonella immobilis TaxID=578942 RepID=A0A1I4V6B7_9GAMM|nr:FAD-dependent oxidoreductase [Dokdonella immobilis]SFM96757.1 Pyruvate/2-oxoglutarate dehydrogenase complex, dihydrolipoamide dehydrogenase (E3) component [Dokdonella immobilis]